MHNRMYLGTSPRHNWPLLIKEGCRLKIGWANKSTIWRLVKRWWVLSGLFHDNQKYGSSTVYFFSSFTVVDAVLSALSWYIRHMTSNVPWCQKSGYSTVFLFIYHGRCIFKCIECIILNCIECRYIPHDVKYSVTCENSLSVDVKLFFFGAREYRENFTICFFMN